ncbi:hypothetical protein B0H14DRAFT_3538517 [Mycena olivaceomarginata]|nr:hypothetical protein B0H14DRAFT_3538517 [Mycena olivaceomarginata]
MPPLPRPRNLPKKRVCTLGATRCAENTLLGKPNQLPMYIVAPGYRAAAHTARVPDPLPAQKRPIIQRARYRVTNEAAGHPSRGEDTSASGDAPRATHHPPHAAGRTPRGSRRPALRRPHDCPALMWELGGMRGQRAKLGRPRSERTHRPPRGSRPPALLPSAAYTTALLLSRVHPPFSQNPISAQLHEMGIQLTFPLVFVVPASQDKIVVGHLIRTQVLQLILLVFHRITRVPIHIHPLIVVHESPSFSLGPSSAPSLRQ